MYLMRSEDETNLAQEIQSWEFMGGCNLVQAATKDWSTIPGMKPLSGPSQFILWQQRVVNFQEKELSHKCSTSAFERLFVAAAATVYQEPHFWRTEGHKLFSSIWPKIFHIWIHCKAWYNLTQDIEFMGGSNLTHAHSNYWICVCFIWVNTVTPGAHSGEHDL